VDTPPHLPAFATGNAVGSALPDKFHTVLLAKHGPFG